MPHHDPARPYLNILAEGVGYFDLLILALDNDPPSGRVIGAWLMKPGTVAQIQSDVALIHRGWALHGWDVPLDPVLEAVLGLTMAPAYERSKSGREDYV